VHLSADDYGGLTKKSQHNLRDASASKKQENSSAFDIGDNPPHNPPESIETLPLPQWLRMYLHWAGSTGNQTPMSFHLAAGLWLLSVAVGRRLYREAPWGIKIYPNLYLMLIVSTTYYRKFTAYKMADAPPYTLIDGLRKLHEKLPMPENSEEGMQPPGKLALNVECWPEVQAYSENLRRLRNPELENELDERLKGVYGRMHVQAFKLAALFAALDWMDSDAPTPTVTLDNWHSAEAIADLWLSSAHRLLKRLDYNGAAQQEQTLQQRMLVAFLQAGHRGEKLYVIYKNLHIPAREARQTAKELVKAGLLSPVQLGRSEGYLHRDFID
jgi:hypothetical protein